MAADAEGSIKFPCYFLYGAEGGLITNFVDGRQCLCLFTSTEAVRRFTVEAHDLHGNKRGYRRAEVDEVEDCGGLIGRLSAAVNSLEGDGIRFISIDPVPGQPTVCGTIRDFIAELEKP
jgi:hypothetical protein